MKIIKINILLELLSMKKNYTFTVNIQTKMKKTYKINKFANLKMTLL